MLAMLERCVTDAGGAYAMCDTDSMAIVATERGEELSSGLAALSWETVDAIIAKFASLNPYDRSAVPGSVLKLEDLNFEPETGERRQLYCHAISAKRYALFNVSESGAPELRRGERR